MSYPHRIGPTQYDAGPRVDLYEASVPVRPRDLLPGDFVAVSLHVGHYVLDVRAGKYGPENPGRWIDFRDENGHEYTVHRTSKLDVVK